VPGSVDRRVFIQALMGGFVAAGVAGRVGASERDVKRPNLVFVFPDEWRGSALGFLGEEPVKTPNIDMFAAESLVLTDVVSNWPVCSPYRGMLLTGMYPHSNGVISNCTSHTAQYGVQLRESDRCWSDVLKDNGYNLGYIGKWHLDSPHEPYIDTSNNRGAVKWNEWTPPHRRHGFDYWYSYGTYDRHMRPMYWDTNAGRQEFKYVNQYGPEHEADQAIDYIRNSGGKLRDGDRPFALVVSMNPPHMAYDAYPERYRGTYDDVPKEVLFGRPNIPPPGTKWGRHYRTHIRDYYSQITAVDEQFGRIVRAIDEAGLGEDTIVIFTSDHGDCVGIHGEQTKTNPYEEAFRVPFIMRWKGKLKPRRDNLLLSTPDIYPTLLEMMGLKDQTPEQVEGVSLAGAMLDGKGTRPDSQLYLRIPVENPSSGQRGVRTGRHTFVVAQQEDGSEKLQLWDREKDPYQLKNIAEEEPELVRELRGRMEEWLKRTRDPWLQKS
jgi:arylsulfatase A-like enzyme